MTTLTVDEFRLAFPAFTVEKYPDSQVQFWLDFAHLMLPESIWGAAYKMGVGLFAAHQMLIETYATKSMAMGVMSPPGALSHKTIGPVSVGYDFAHFLMPGAGHWNMTVYGLRFWQLARLMGTRPIHIAGWGATAAQGPPLAGPLSSANAWAGPWVYNFPNPVQ